MISTRYKHVQNNSIDTALWDCQCLAWAKQRNMTTTLPTSCNHPICNDGRPWVAGDVLISAFCLYFWHAAIVLNVNYLDWRQLHWQCQFEWGDWEAKKSLPKRLRYRYKQIRTNQLGRPTYAIVRHRAPPPLLYSHSSEHASAASLLGIWEALHTHRWCSSDRKIQASVRLNQAVSLEI